ncbi:MAG TPA: hypothetical protein VK307_09930 [Thermoleophilaceae bacterium]|nr:hypothetical protein [Thermoleophilaceae bacterium]
MADRQRRRLTGQRNYARLREYKATHVTAEWMGRLGAHSAGIGRKEVEGRRTDTLALLFYVERKQPAAQLSAEPVPEYITFLSRKEKRDFRLPTDVIETPQPSPEQDPETRIRPVPGGVSFGRSGSTGTLGGWVWDTTDDTIVAVTNNHVLGNTIGADTLQQGTADGGSLPGDKIGDVKRSVARMAPGTNLVDCAITDVDDADNVDARVLEIGTAVYAVETPVLDMQVEKYGQTTRHTFGEITDVDYETSSTDGFAFDDQIRIVPVDPSDDWSAGGDSGSLVFSQTPASGNNKPAVGLHWGGSGANGVACKIQNVFSALDLTTICAGLFAAFLDALFETEEEGEIAPETERRLRNIAAAAPATGARAGVPLPVTARARRTAAARRFHAGISRDIQARLETSKRGRLITELVDSHRAELTDLLLKDGDVRRATVATLRPIVAGATTSTEVLERALTGEDLTRLERLADAVARRTSDRVDKSLGPVRRLARSAEGKTPAEILGITL